MPSFPNEEIDHVQQRLLDGMKSYQELAGDDCSYDESDIDQVKAILDGYRARLAKGGKLARKQIREEVRQAVVALNALNEKLDGSLIETDQREALCQILLVAAKQAGLGTDDDITEEWREW